MESKEIQQAKTIQYSLNKTKEFERSRRPQEQGGFTIVKPSDMIPNFDRLRTVDENEGIYCCLECRAEIRRMELHAFGDPEKGGKGGPIIRPLAHCGCAAARDKKEQEKAERRERRARLQKHYSKNIVSPAIVNARFENWKPRSGTEKAHSAALEFERDFETRTLGLLLTGQAGNGKSHLARSAQVAIDQRGWVTLFLDWPQLVELAKGTFDQYNVSVADIVRGACDADLLVLDELGAGKLTDWEFKTLLFPIINNRAGKKTIITTNLDMAELENWFRWGRIEGPEKNVPEIDAKGRLYDRILGNFQLIKNSGTSKRREDAIARMQQ